MSQTLFPLVPMGEAEVATAQELPLARDVAWDYETDKPKFKNGAPVMATGLEAVLSWAQCALRVVRYRHEIFTPDYGNEVESMIGQAYTEALKSAEAQRFIREALLINPYITSVPKITVSFADSILSISCNIETIYGGAELHV